MKYKNKTFLITGGSGELGTEFLKLFVEKANSENNRIMVLSRNPMKNKTIAEFADRRKITTIKCDLSDLEKLEKIKNKIKHTTNLIHLSAQITDKNDMGVALNQIKFNTISLLRLIKFLPNLRHVIFSSSYFVYGGEKAPHLTEFSEAKLVNVYSLGKFSAEQILKIFGSVNDIPICILRFSSLYGPSTSKRNFIPDCLIKAKNKEKITIFGDGEHSKNYLFIEDAAKALELSLEQRANGIYNIGGSKTYSLNEIANLAIRITKSDSKIEYTGKNNRNLYFNLLSKKAKNDLGFKPKFSIEKGMTKIMECL
tara:strand:+ start:491 stop:1423 length:933 start_codon:yes stop_codon:yes gene_type:complete